jgi:hypothetical protein
MIKLIDFEKIHISDIYDQISSPKNRRSTANMIMAQHLVTTVLENLNEELKGNKIDIIFCTAEGELDQTYKFYDGLSNQGIARPIFFQNSLHNSTLGSVSIKHKNLSLGVTIASGDVSFENAVTLQLVSPSKNPFIIVSVDSYPEHVLEIKLSRYNNVKSLSSEANIGLFLPESHPSFSNTKGLIIKDVNYKVETGPLDTLTHHSPTNTLSKIKETPNYTTTMKIPRPNGMISTFTFGENDVS